MAEGTGTTSTSSALRETILLTLPLSRSSSHWVETLGYHTDTTPQTAALFEADVSLPSTISCKSDAFFRQRAAQTGQRQRLNELLQNRGLVRQWPVHLDQRLDKLLQNRGLVRQ